MEETSVFCLVGLLFVYNRMRGTFAATNNMLPLQQAPTGHCFTKKQQLLSPSRLTYLRRCGGYGLSVSLRLSDWPVEEQSVGYNGPVPPTQSCKYSLFLFLCFPDAHEDADIHALFDKCTVAHSDCLPSAFLTEWAEHR